MAEKVEEKAKSEEISPDSSVESSWIDIGNSAATLSGRRSLVVPPVVNGLKLKKSCHERPFKSFDYRFAIVYNADLVPTDWHVLSICDTVDAHIRIHKLKEGDNLLESAEKYLKNNAKAMIVINNTEQSILSQKLSQPLQKLDSFLVAVLANSDGLTLCECLNVECESDKLFGRLDADSSEAIPLTGSHARSKAKDFFFKLLPSRSNWTASIKKLMFHGDTMFDISADRQRFALIMEQFSDYEGMEKPDPYLVNELMIRCEYNLNVSFQNEFPFFLILIYRFIKFKQKYDCEEFIPFIVICIKMFERLSPYQVVETLKSFLKRKDFRVQFGDENVDTSVFALLAVACCNLMNSSIHIKNNNPNATSMGLLYCKLLWISVHVKCLEEKGTMTMVDSQIWHECFVKAAQEHVLMNEQSIIKELKLGFKVSSLLELLPDHQLTTHHLVQFLVVQKHNRPLSFVGSVIAGLEDFIKTDEDLLYHVLINLRAHYLRPLQSSDFVCQGISFLESMNKLWYKKEWNKGKMQEEFRAECLEWMKFLLGIVCVTDSNAPKLLKKFLEPNEGSSIMVDEYFRSQNVHIIMEQTRKSFPKLTIQLFLPLYNVCKVWPKLFLHDYLKQYRIPNGIKISDVIWSEFFEVIIEHNDPQEHILEFLLKVADVYRTNKRAGDFIPDVFQLQVPHLFYSDTEIGTNGVSAVGERFSDFLKGYMQRNNLRRKLMSRIQEIIKYISEDEQIELHSIIFNVLHSEVIPEVKSLQDDDEQSTKQFKDLLNVSVNTICQKISLSGPFSPQIKFYWGVVAAVCSKIPITAESSEWIIDLESIIMELLVVFSTYCNIHKLSDRECLVTEIMPEVIVNCTLCDVHQYFQWVRTVQDMLHLWQKKLQNGNVNYDEIMMYVNNNAVIDNLGHAVHAATYVFSMEDIMAVKDTFTLHFELLNCFLLRCISNHPEAGYCTLPELLRNYGVSLPLELQEALQQKVIFPGSKRKVPEEQKLKNNIFPFGNRHFNPNQSISLKVVRSFYLCQLKKMFQDLQNFLQPITEHMEMFVFFHLHNSKVFINHLLRLLDETATVSLSNQIKKTIPDLQHSTNRPSFAFASKKDTKQAKGGIPITVLQSALCGFKDLLLKVVKGTATYSDIIPGGALELETLNLEDEFATLTKYSESFKINQGNCEGLEGVKCMLELLQLIYYIVQVQQVCQQYGLEKCLKDLEMRKMLSIAEELKLEESRVHLTVTEAKKNMTIIKKALCLEGSTNHSCLDLFPAVANSAAFYQFIRDKQFIGSKGQTLFREQYQLITAQLQHEEYDENVLNHLRVAYEFIVPFMETDISLFDLMSRVTKLDATKGLKQLETVNQNIILIRLWFSRAEGDTIENVANELQDILSTGIYQFQLNGDSSILLIYQTMQNMGSQRRTVINGTSLEDSVQGKNGTKGMPSSPMAHHPPLFTTLKDEEGHSSSAFGSVEQRWTNEQIADFVRKLGFLDTKTVDTEMIKQFLHLNLTANKLLKLFFKLFELGHPGYQKYRNLPILPCDTHTAKADAMVYRIQETLIGWHSQVVALRKKHTWLLFFSIPKVLHLYSLIINLKLDLHSIVLEVSFLFENTNTVRHKLENVVEESIKEMEINGNGDTSMEYLGEFLHLVCGSKKLQDFLCKKRSLCHSSSNSHLTSQLSTAMQVASFQLHYTPGYSQSQLVRLITDLYKGVPECYEVFHCTPYTTQEEVHLFIERIKHHPLTYLVLQVDKLPFNLQELLITFLKQANTLEGPQKRSSVNFIETSPSMLREVPWITCQEYKGSGPNLSIEEADCLCKSLVVQSADFTCIQLVYGHAGDGKTYYIRQQLAKSPAGLTVPVNEAFNPLHAIISLNTLPKNVFGCAVFFNFTLMPYQESQDEMKEKKAVELIENIGWFFYHFLVLGYVEDPTTGISFRFPGGQKWAIYIEVPSLDHTHRLQESLQLFTEKFSTLGLLGSSHLIEPATPITVNADVQLVCKYLKAYKRGGITGIDRLIIDKGIVKFSMDPDLSDNECHELLLEFMPNHIQETKITQKLFIRYMTRRCAFLDILPAFNYNNGLGEMVTDQTGQKIMTDTSQLGSTLMQTMLEEVDSFCDPDIRSNWAEKPHHQLIYDFRDGGGSFGLLSSELEKIPEAQYEKYKKIGFQLHTSSELENREVLDQMLARALVLPSEATQRLSVIDDCNYVLTLDYTIKMLNIHERYSCGVPVILKGETGVGKTALMEMLSRLWSSALLYLWDKEKGVIVDAIKNFVSTNLTAHSQGNCKTHLEIMEAINEGREVSINDLMILNSMCPSKGLLFSHLSPLLLDMENNPVIALLEVSSCGKGQDSSLVAMIQSNRENNSAHMTATLLQTILKAKIRKTFYKLNVHAALTPHNIKTFFDPVFKLADNLKKASFNVHQRKKTTIKMPFITVFLDEVNTSSCLGLFKEIIIDKTLDGKPIPQNVFIVAACNPHRGNSMATHATETWIRSSYYVRPLHPTLEYLMWDYGSLDKYQERDYIRAKLRMFHKELPNLELLTLTDLVVESQSLMREYALRQHTKQKMKPEEAEVSSKSCVSQRDIQRVFTFYEWLISVYSKCKQHGIDRIDYGRRALMVSLGIVYYLRLNSEYRRKYEQVLDEKVYLTGVKFSKVFNEELDFFCGSVQLPTGIAKTQALKENLFGIIACTLTHTPLVIVGAPGSSKTLSFSLAINNLKGLESKTDLFRKTDIFKSLDPHFYQCSRRTTSDEVQTVFSRAINRQRSHTKFSLPIYCVVFMDEAGLPEESHESLKVLHYHLDRQEVSFVAITNHVLDAAKTNRAVSLFRPEVSEEDLETLAKGCLSSNPDNPLPHLKQDLETIAKFCPAYSQLIKDPKQSRFFGLRDFIHFIHYLRRRRAEGITPELVAEALERNFNGVCWSDEHHIFQAICKPFLDTMAPPLEKKPMAVKWRGILEILKESLEDHSKRSRNEEDQVRYKLLIDPTEDNSLMHLLISFGVLDRKNTRIYMCSDFPGDSHIQKINIIAAIRHSAIEGHTVVMSQTDDIHESFYDLFNQTFRRIDDPENGPRYYANIAIGPHSKPCRVHPDFKCIVVVKQTEVESTPAPFLNRFEKYFISHETILSTVLNHLEPCMRTIVQTAREKVNEFINVVGRDNSVFYGLKPQTLDSLVLSVLPPYGHKYKETLPEDPICDNVRICLLHELLRAIRNSAGFTVPACSFIELEMDASHLFLLLDSDAKFKGALDFLTVDTVNKAVNEAIYILHTASSPYQEGVATSEMSEQACLVVSILQQWLIRNFCKTLMQLLTPEGVCLHRKKIPASLIDNYLTNQQHFSLKKLIKHHLLALESCQSTYLCSSNKLLIFTRSSSIIHHLPTTYPNPAAPKESVLDDRDITRLRELLHDDLTYVQVCRVLSFQSQIAIQGTLKDFIHEPDRKILLLIVNMREATIEMVNHLRIMIEETEIHTPPITYNKLFVVLLHFPPTMFFDSCYPSLFLHGWNHYYLDSIDSHHSGKLNIEEWFQRCCFLNREFVGDSLLEACNFLLIAVVPVLVSKITFGTRSSSPFIKDMKAGERSERLRELLFDKGIGRKLCEIFRNCWLPNVMTEYLELAAVFTQSRESSMNLTDAVQTKFHSLFTEFMILMVTRLSIERNLDILFAQENCSEVDKLFLSLLETVKPPKLDQLETLTGSLPQPRPQEYQPMFPFFSMVNRSMEQLIEDSRKTIGHRDNLLGEHPEVDNPTVSLSGGVDSRMMDLAELVFTTLDKQLQEESITQSDELFIALKYIITHSDTLWDRYFSDFIYHTLNIDIVTFPLSREVISAFFSDFLEQPLLQRFVNLHIYVDYNKIEMSNICSLLRPLEKIWVATIGYLHPLDTASSSLAEDFIKVIRETKHPFGDPKKMSSFVISALFSAIVGTIFPQQKRKEQKEIRNNILEMWYRTYQQVMSLPSLRSHLYMTKFHDSEEAKFNVMHATFALIHIYPVVDEDVLSKGHNLFTTLYAKFFNANRQLKNLGVVPSLAECSKLASKLISNCMNYSSARSLSQAFLEELFNHFLSPYRTSYSRQDREWFLRHANCQNEWKAFTHHVNSSHSEDLLDVTMGTYKRYLSLLLRFISPPDDREVSASGPLMMYNAEARQNVASVLSESKSGEEPGPYIPTFYQDCHVLKPSKNSENHLMQQPLCHLYFATLMEHLINKSRSVNSLIELDEIISHDDQLSRPQSVPVGDRIILQIEKQAVIQCLLHRLASLFSDSNASVAKELAPIKDELNQLLDDDSTGGGAIGGHCLTLGMHILHKLHSHRRFTELFTTRYPIIREIRCTKLFHERLRTQAESKPYLFPFMCHNDQYSPLSDLYQKVKYAMLSIHQSRGSQEYIDQLVNVAKECVQNRPPDNINKIQAFKMIIWLVTYYDFFVKKISSQAVSLVVGQQLKNYINNESVIRLVQSYLCKNWLVKKKESPVPLREDTLMLKVLPGGHTIKLDHEEEKTDPLYDLFVPNCSSSRDQSDDDLCHCLANLVGAVLCCQPQSNHLWYHLFSPDELKDTYMTGFMYDAKINAEGLLYDCGIELTPDGQYGRPDYLPHATRGTYSLHSLYFLLWANLGALCVSMLTQPDSQSKIHGVIISEWQAIRHYCVTQVKALWMNLRNNLSLSDEKRCFLVTRCFKNLYESAGTSLGKFSTKEELNHYETFWHERVFSQAWQEVHDNFEESSVLQQNQLFIEICQLETCYPQYPNEKDFLYYIQGLLADNGYWRLLARFAAEKQRLEVGGQLLPMLIKLYRWLHTFLAYLVTGERAYRLKIGEVIHLTSRVSPSLGELYQNVKELYNTYVELVGGAIGQGACAAVRRGNRLYTIEDDLPLIHFLSDSKEEGEGNDWLYVVIQDIASLHNHLIHTLYTNMGNEERGKHSFAHLLPQDPSHIDPTEANEYSCIVGKQTECHGLNEFLQLVRARQNPPLSYLAVGSPSDAQVKPMSFPINKMLQHPSLSFDLTRLQEDIVSHYLSGKPFIQDISGMRTVFKFRHGKNTSGSKGFDPDPMHAASDITFLGDALPPAYQLLLDTNHSHHLEYEFHSATYHMLKDIVIGLRTAVGLLIKVLKNEIAVPVQNLDKLTLHEFMLSQYGAKESEQYKVLNQIGIQDVSDAQLRLLSSTKLSLLFSTLELFVGWVKDGIYDFSSLSVALKVQLSKDDFATLEQIPVKYPGISSNLLIELKVLVEVLLHTEPHIVKEINQIAQESLIEVLDNLGLTSGLDQLLKLIPNTVLVHHYVKFRIILRKLTLIIEQKIAMDTSQDTSDQKQWCEIVDDLWSKDLPHLREKGFVFIDLTLLMSAQYGFYGDGWEEEEDNELGINLNKDAYDEFSEDGPPKPDFDEPHLKKDDIRLNVKTIEETEMLKQGLEDPETCQKFLKLMREQDDIEKQAKEWSPQMISQFLEGVGKKKHAKTFLDEDIDGVQLLNADRDVYKDLGVTSNVECAQIAVLFKRQLMGVEIMHCSMSELIDINKKLASHLEILEKAGVNVDMLKFAQQNDFLADLLKDVGIAKSVDRNRFQAALKSLSESVASSGDTQHRVSNQGYVAYSTTV